MKPEAGTHLPEEQQQLMRRATKLEWASIGYAACTIALVALVVGNSQAMRTAWIEDMLSVLPQVAFLAAGIYVRKSRRPTHPYGYHRTMSAGHLVAGVALLAIGALLAYEAISALVKVEHPTIGTMNLFGYTIWQGWLMIAIMTMLAIPAVILGHLKIKTAKPLNNKLLYADASMAKADWQTNVSFHCRCGRHRVRLMVARWRRSAGDLGGHRARRLEEYPLGYRGSTGPPGYFL